ncbi:MAG: S41 family peptidase, partial [Bacteroidota bacterium]
PILESIILSLRDGHVDFITSKKEVGFDFTLGYPENKPDFVDAYLHSKVRLNTSLETAKIKGAEIGYIRVVDFIGPRSSYDIIEEVLNDFKDKRGIIFDIRSNGGGNTENALAIAARLIDQERIYRKHQYRLGVNRYEFTPWINTYISPIGTTAYQGKICVLTNRSTYSAAEDFVLMMRVRPNTITVGGATGGGSGKPLWRVLPNGWKFRLSHWLVKTPEDFFYEEIGIQPDFPMVITPEDEAMHKDPILEKAIDLMK